MSETRKIAVMAACSTAPYNPEATKRYQERMEKEAKEAAHRTRFPVLDKGDVFRWGDLADCVHLYTHNDEDGSCTLDVKRLKLGDHWGGSITFRRTETREGGWERKIEETLDLTATDESRGTAEFVVVDAHRKSGGQGHGPGDTYPDYWQVNARRLNGDGTFDSDGETVLFSQYLSGGEIESHRRMEMEFK